jgi:Ca2+-binding RTX toxin-like protein
MIGRATGLAILLALGAAAPAAAFIGPYTGVGTGSSDHYVHTNNSDQSDVVDSKHVYKGRFTYSFRIDPYGTIDGRGDGTFQSATWRLDGRNDNVPFGCNPPITTSPNYEVEINGFVTDGRAHLTMSLLDAHEDNLDYDCGADYTADESHTTYLANSLRVVQGDDGLVLDPDHPRIGPLRLLTETGEPSNRSVVLDEWDITIHPPPPNRPQDAGPNAPPGVEDRPPGKGSSSICTIEGTRRADHLKGTKRNDIICGFGGNDTIDGRGGNDLVYGGPGNDRIKGGRGRDVLYGNFGKDSFNTRDGKKDKAHGGFDEDRASADRRDRTIAIEHVSRR